MADMPLGLQVKLLRVLSESQISPLGARAPKAVNLRLNAAVLRLPALHQRSDLATMMDRLLSLIGNPQPAHHASACASHTSRYQLSAAGPPQAWQSA